MLPDGFRIGRDRFDDDLFPRSAAAAARPAPQRAAVFGDLEPAPARDLPGFRAVFPRAAAGALGTCRDCGPHEAGGAPPPRGGRGHQPLRPAAGLSTLKRAGSAGNEKAVHGALIRHGTMLSTSVNPTDGPRFDG